MRILLFTIITIITVTNLSYSKIASVIGDPISGELFFEVNKNTKNYPASLTKMMTLYILFQKKMVRTTFLKLCMNTIKQ